MRGYLVHKKNIHYYKCNTPGCKNNKNAEILHDVFKNKLCKYTFDIQSKHLIKTQMIATYNQNCKEKTENEETLTARLNEVSKKLERLEERYVLEEISQELFEKYKSKFLEEKGEIQKQFSQCANKGSNLLECVDDALTLCLKLPDLWDFVGFTAKQRLQFLVFPQGIRYNKETDECRTEEENEFAVRIVEQSKSYNGSEKNGRGKSCDVAPFVAPSVQLLNPKAVVSSLSEEKLWQIYEDLKLFYKIKDLIEPLEANRLKEQQEQTGCNQEGNKKAITL